MFEDFPKVPTPVEEIPEDEQKVLEEQGVLAEKKEYVPQELPKLDYEVPGYLRGVFNSWKEIPGAKKYFWTFALILSSVMGGKAMMGNEKPQTDPQDTKLEQVDNTKRNYSNKYSNSALDDIRLVFGSDR
jgi:hypothetical protein